MGKSKKYQSVSDFNLDAQLLGFIFKGSGKVKSIRVATDRGVWAIKLEKSLRSELPALQPGDWVRVRGEKTIDFKKGKSKLKAWDILPLADVGKEPIASPAPKKAPVGKVLICQKSSCCKRGAKAVLGALENRIEESQLGDRVRIQKTGCLKGCKRGPNLVVVPDKTRYEKVTPEEAGNLVDRHFGTVSTEE